MNKVHVIVNPFSARGKTGKKWSMIKEIIKSYFKEFKFIHTEKPKQATEIARELLKEGFDLIIGVGGDGTLNEITNGFFHQNSKKIINQYASLGIIPSGTGSDFIRFLKIPRDFKKSTELIKNSPVKKIDIGKITFTGNTDNPPESKYFVNISDFGLGAEVIKSLSAMSASKRSTFQYYRGLLATIRTYNSKNVSITIDDNELISGKFLIGAIANGRIFGGGMIIAPDAEPDDGYFDLVLIKDMKKFEIIRNSPKLYSGKIKFNPKVIIKRAKKISITTDEEVNVEYDGELGSTLPAEFEIIEKQLNFRF